MAGLFQRIAQNYRKKKKITQPSARLYAKEDKTEHATGSIKAFPNFCKYFIILKAPPFFIIPFSFILYR